MYVCVCNKVSDSDIRDALDKGMRKNDILKRYNVGSDCGVCLISAIEQIEIEKQESSNNKSHSSKR